MTIAPKRLVALTVAIALLAGIAGGVIASRLIAPTHVVAARKAEPTHASLPSLVGRSQEVAAATLQRVGLAAFATVACS